MGARNLTEDDVEAVAEAVFHKISSLMSTTHKSATLPGDTKAKPKAEKKKPRELPRFLNDREIEAILKAARQPNPRIPGGPARDELLIRLGLDAGLRAAEIAMLEWRDIDYEDDELTVRQGKGSKPRTVFISKDLKAVLREFQFMTGFPPPTSPVLPSRKGGPLSVRAIEHVVTRVCHNAGLTGKLHPHMLRHTFAHRWRERGGDPQVLQSQLGHASISTTLDIYGTISTKTKKNEFRRVMDEVPTD